jgi:hypothetical protein
VWGSSHDNVVWGSSVDIETTNSDGADLVISSEDAEAALALGGL